MPTLDEILHRTQARMVATKNGETIKAKLRDPRLADNKERDETAARLRAWESAHEYAAVALVFRDVCYTCVCGSRMHAGGQIMVKEAHIRIARTVRYLPAVFPYPDLPRVRDFAEVTTQVCAECAERFGFKETK